MSLTFDAIKHRIQRKPKRRSLGIVQFTMLQKIHADPASAYGTAIAANVGLELGRDIPDAQIFLALKRMEDHGLIAEQAQPDSAPSKRSRGRPRKYYALTGIGRSALINAGSYELEAEPILKEAKERLLDGLQKEKTAHSVVG